MRLNFSRTYYIFPSVLFHNKKLVNKYGLLYLIIVNYVLTSKVYLLFDFSMIAKKTLATSEIFQAMTSVKSTSTYIASSGCFRSWRLERTPFNSITPNLQEQETGKRMKLPNAELDPAYNFLNQGRRRKAVIMVRKLCLPFVRHVWSTDTNLSKRTLNNRGGR